MLKRRNLWTSLLAFLLSFSLMACGSEEVTTSEDTSQIVETTEETETTTSDESIESGEATGNTIEFIDDVGRTVEIPENIERVLGTGSTSQAVLYTLVPEKMVGWNSAPNADELEYLPDEAAKMEEVGSLFGGGEQISLEEVVALDPDVIIDIGEQKPNIEEDLNQLQENTGTPVIFFDGMIEDMPVLYEKFWELFDIDTSEQVAYITETLDFADENRTAIQENPREYYLGSGDDGYRTAPQDSFQTETADFIGMTNIFQVDDESDLGWQEISPEQVMEWNPEVVLFHTYSGFEDRNEVPWNAIEASERGQIYEIPDAPFNWMTGSVNRILGIKWLGNLVYPEIYDMDMIEEAQGFYELFYHYNLSEEEARELMGHSTFLEE